MVKTKSELLVLLEENGVKINYKDIYISEEDKNGYIVSFVLTFGKNDLVYVYDKDFGYISFFYKG